MEPPAPPCARTEPRAATSVEIVCRLQREGFGALPSVWADLGMESGSFHEQIEASTRCSGDRVGCFALLDGDTARTKAFVDLAVRPAARAAFLAALDTARSFVFVVVSPGFTAEADGPAPIGGDSQVLAFERRGGGERFLGAVDVDARTSAGAAWPGRLLVQTIGKSSWLVLRHHAHCGTGCLFLPERWFALSRSTAPSMALRADLEASHEGYVIGFVPFFDQRYTAEIAETGVAAGRPFVTYRVSVQSSIPQSVFDGAPDPSSNGEPQVPLLDVTGVVRYRHDGTRFVIDPRPGTWSAAELAGAEGHSARAWVELARAQLVRVASTPGRRRDLLRAAFPRHCTGDGTPSCASSAAARQIESLLR